MYGLRIHARHVVCFLSLYIYIYIYANAMQVHANETVTNWNKKQHHIDIWIESTELDDGDKVIGCENTLTPKHGIRVIRNPGEKLRVVGMSPGSAYGGRFTVWMLTRFRGTVISGWKVLYRTYRV